MKRRRGLQTERRSCSTGRSRRRTGTSTKSSQAERACADSPAIPASNCIPPGPGRPEDRLCRTGHKRQLGDLQHESGRFRSQPDHRTSGNRARIRRGLRTEPASPSSRRPRGRESVAVIGADGSGRKVLTGPTLAVTAPSGRPTAREWRSPPSTSAPSPSPLKRSASPIAPPYPERRERRGVRRRRQHPAQIAAATDDAVPHARERPCGGEAWPMAPTTSNTARRILLLSLIAVATLLPPAGVALAADPVIYAAGTSPAPLRSRHLNEVPRDEDL